MKTAILRCPFLIVLLFLLPRLDQLTGEVLPGMSYNTVYREDRFFETGGRLLIRGEMDDLTDVLLDFDSYGSWVLEGLTRKTARHEELPAFLVDVIVRDELRGSFNIIYDLNKFLKIRNLSAPFKSEWDTGTTGSVRAIRFIYTGKKSFLRAGRYSFKFRQSDEGILVEFLCEVRLSGLLDLFFTVQSYDKNMGYYIAGLSENLRKRLE